MLERIHRQNSSDTHTHALPVTYTHANKSGKLKLMPIKNTSAIHMCTASLIVIHTSFDL